jgi:Zn-dependent protease
MISSVATILRFSSYFVVAAHDWIVGKQRRRYRREFIIKAPKEIVRRLLTASELTLAKGSVRMVSEPLAGVEGGEVARVLVRGRPYPRIAFQRSKPAPDVFLFHYLPEFSERTDQMGVDDVWEISLESLADGSTRMRLARTLTHRRAGTRISAPLWLGMVARLCKSEAEQEAGHEPAPRSRLARPIWLLATIASFWWLLGWLDAMMLILVVIVHELGHAVAMLVTGRGVRIITLIPFLGGMASPKYPYEDEWQRGFVALMGPSLSLIPTLGLLWLAFSTNSALAAHAAFMFAVVNGANLLPLVPLDGGIILDALVRSIHARLSQTIGWIGVGIGLCLALYARSVLIGIVFVFGGLQLTLQASLDTHARRKGLSGLQAPALTAALALTIFAYWTIIVQTYQSAVFRAGLDGPQAFAHKTERSISAEVGTAGGALQTDKANPSNRHHASSV